MTDKKITEDKPGSALTFVGNTVAPSTEPITIPPRQWPCMEVDFNCAPRYYSVVATEFADDLRVGDEIICFGVDHAPHEPDDKFPRMNWSLAILCRVTEIKATAQNDPELRIIAARADAPLILVAASSPVCGN